MSGPIVLCILDGWGHRAPGPDNAIFQANTPQWDRITAQYPMALLDASQTAVGLPEGQIGNSEVGHMTIGAGRRINQDIIRIGDMLDDGSLYGELDRIIAHLRSHNATLHMIGLTSHGGVHASLTHQMTLLDRLAGENIPIAVHIITDGRDNPPQSASEELAALIGRNDVKLVSISGRYYAMDRDNNWQRTERYARAILHGDGPRADHAMQAVTAAYAQDIHDEFIPPTILGDYHGMANNDCILMTNFRADRARQILQILCKVDCPLAPHEIALGPMVGLGDYGDNLRPFVTNIAPKRPLEDVLAACCAAQNLRQLRIGETEKYAHVTFFFNGGREAPFPGEERILIPSPKVATYDLQPQMSAPALTDALVDAIAKRMYDLIIVNYANADMVGHTGKMDAAIAAVECLDQCLGRLMDAVLDAQATLLITADHGNIEQMYNAQSGQNHTAHTLNPVPFVVVSSQAYNIAYPQGTLCDIAPTILHLLQIEQPAIMDGICIITPRD
ncbi:MAG: 2,3-bisphosphoglycerate-independent phosphoglycerate mutase [Pseudomonadota bacterium]